MMKQLLKQIYNERRSNAFLWIELLLVFVVLWYIVDLVYVTLHIYYQPMGFNIENTYVLRMNRLTDKSTDFNPELTVKDDMTALREIAGKSSDERARMTARIGPIRFSLHEKEAKSVDV